MLPSALTDVIEALSRLPGVGSRTAERYAYFLLKADQNVAKNIATSLEQLPVLKKMLFSQGFCRLCFGHAISEHGSQLVTSLQINFETFQQE